MVCSAKEAQVLREKCGQDFLLVTPGIRLENDSADDQKRMMTPQVALKMSADYLVMGRSVTHAKDPAAVLRQLH